MFGQVDVGLGFDQQKRTKYILWNAKFSLCKGVYSSKCELDCGTTQCWNQ